MDPSNLAYWRRFARIARDGNVLPQAIWGYERALEIILGLEENSWKSTMLNVRVVHAFLFSLRYQSIQKPPEDLIWIQDSGAEAGRGIQDVLDIYLQVDSSPLSC